MTAGEGESMPTGVDETARQQVENQLLDAYAAGRLSDDDFDRRIKLAVGATAQSGLDEAVKDIPEGAVAPSPDPSPVSASSAAQPTPSAAESSPSATESTPSATESTPSATESAPSAGEPPTSGVAARLASTLSPASPPKPAAASANPLALDTEGPDFPEYPHRDPAPRASTSPYGHQAPVETPNPYQSPYGPPPSPYGAQAGAELSPYGQQRPGTGRVVAPGEGAAGSNKATGALAHFLGLFTWLVGPGIVYAVSPEGSTAKKEAAKSFNFQAVAMIALIVAGIATVILPSFIESILFPLLWLGWLLGTVIGGAKAAQGEDWQNPVTKVIKLKILPEK